jgi:demethylmenaquinone methyltransferase/2-methoxy-6-polyprenyl-1,4-benzoquinol methylase
MVEPGQLAGCCRTIREGNGLTFHRNTVDPEKAAVLMRGPPTRDPLWTDEQLSSPHDVADKSHRVRAMFDAIAPRYELVNSLFSLGRDAAWRAAAVRLSAVDPGESVLDVACGTGDLARQFAKTGVGVVIGCDFAREMLRRAASRPNAEQREEPSRIHWVEADALNLPFPAGCFNVVSCAFGVRNLQDPATGLREMLRVLRPGGRAVILEFSRPRNRLGAWVFGIYSHRIMPPAASWVSGDRTGAYRYLPRSVSRFPDGEGFCRMMSEVGFRQVRSHSLTLGIVAVYVGQRAPA